MLVLLLACAPEPQPVDPPPEVIEPPPAAWAVHVDRTARTLTLTAPDGTVTTQAIGIGKGGLVEKTKMADYVTPTGTFTVDLLLHEAGTHNAVAPPVVASFADDPEYHQLLSGPEGLAQLFANMSALDFDKDGQPDRAYGSAYIGLHADDAITGPKMSRYDDTARWFSIALHGTPDEEANLGEANSGGCVHLPKTLLDRLIEEEIVSIGSTVTIGDS